MTAKLKKKIEKYLSEFTKEFGEVDSFCQPLTWEEEAISLLRQCLKEIK